VFRLFGILKTLLSDKKQKGGERWEKLNEVRGALPPPINSLLSNRNSVWKLVGEEHLWSHLTKLLTNFTELIIYKQ